MLVLWVVEIDIILVFRMKLSFRLIGLSKGLYIKRPKQILFSFEKHLFRRKSVVF